MTRHHVLALLLVALALTPALGGPPAAAQDATPAPSLAATAGAVTDLRYFLPFTPAGLNPHLTATTTEAGSCDDPSAQALDRPDAWNCTGADNQIYDPCFENPFIPPDQPPLVACVDSPFRPAVVVLRLQRPLARQKEAQGPVAAAMGPGAASNVAANATSDGDNPYSIAPWDLPWALELANGDRCTLARGTLTALAGQTVYYGCANGGTILGEVRHQAALWTVNYVAPGAVASTLIPVAVAWS